MEVDLIHASLPRVTISDFPVSEMVHDVVPLDVFWPIPLLFDQSGGINTSLLQLNDALQHTTPAVQNNNMSFAKQGLQNRNMSKSKGWTLQSSLLTLWMGKTRVNNQTKIDDNANLLKTL